MPPEFESAERKTRETAAGRIVIELDDAALLVALSLHPNGSGKPFTEQGILEMLVDFDVQLGTDPQAIRAAIGDETLASQPLERVIIAKGQPPVPGKDAYMDFPLLESMPRQEDDPDDPHLLCERYIVNALEGQAVGILHPAEEGIAGISVRDMPIPVRNGVDDTPKPIRKLRWENNALIAEADGRLFIEQRSIFVDEILKINSDLTITFGDIDFVGGVVINGDIESGVTVKCLKNMEVRGTIACVDVECGGLLRVRNGIIGSDETSVTVGGDLEVGFVENATLNVGGNCIIKDNFATSTLVCSGSLIMKQGRGHFVSGLAAVRDEIIVRNVGIQENTKARLSVGRDRLAEERLQQMNEEIAETAERLKELDEFLQQRGPGSPSYKLLTPEECAEVEEKLEERPELETELTEAGEKRKAMLKKTEPNPNAVINITRILHADTIIEFPQKKVKVCESLAGVTFKFNQVEEKIEAKASKAA